MHAIMIRTPSPSKVHLHWMHAHEGNEASVGLAASRTQLSKGHSGDETTPAAQEGILFGHQ